MYAIGGYFMHEYGIIKVWMGEEVKKITQEEAYVQGLENANHRPLATTTNHHQPKPPTDPHQQPPPSFSLSHSHSHTGHTYPSERRVPSHRRRSSVVPAKSSLVVFKLGAISALVSGSLPFRFPSVSATVVVFRSNFFDVRLTILRSLMVMSKGILRVRYYVTPAGRE
ncbi:hypothetical protein PIB30_047213 [Stylosanthes scabra]|uniref:Uncharacterized protein n=1 Tax=Stylosanthes scabra TaxID=79078 RepID=A0ABU6UFC3_9FABA|nr:hypothetical protein [Stylosanthes scabra]